MKCARVRGDRDGSPLKGWLVCHAAPDGSLAHKFAALPIEKVEAPQVGRGRGFVRDVAFQNARNACEFTCEAI